MVVADNLLTGFRAAVHPKARFYQADIRDRAAMDKLFQTEHIDGVIHLSLIHIWTGCRTRGTWEPSGAPPTPWGRTA